MDILVYAIIAAVLAYRLYTILGQRGEGERQRPNPFSLKMPDDAPGKTTPPAKDNSRTDDVLAIPVSPANPNDRANPLSAVYAAPAPNSLAGGLYAIRQADPSFDEKNFLKGARMAFEMVVHAFAAAERDALKNLMSARLYDTFAGALDARERAGEKTEMKMLSVRDAEIVTARLEGDNATIGVQFVSDQKRETHDRDGQVKDPGTLQQLSDIWTFRRSVKATDPNWTIIETRSA